MQPIVRKKYNCWTLLISNVRVLAFFIINASSLKIYFKTEDDRMDIIEKIVMLFDVILKWKRTSNQK